MGCAGGVSGATTGTQWLLTPDIIASIHGLFTRSFKMP
jgi:hypothetical protein